ncbi:uncharacterized protein KY384_001171 [Bacidia gigantensis]|uniref:uncharacterized protein n=1 Tax=Bacidia gigantensis TaxID=2732470 RepID=UPI001D05617E|nr:uncharacterized protein KY384_001171 [Bacidia gigantensis]KAG8534327.1 hypothetical protein KY384_001171 [Bacidia gigantensis]
MGKKGAKGADIPGSRADELEAAGEEDARAWWRRKDHPVKGGKEGEVEIVYEGLEEGMAAIAEAIRTEGPFNGVIGFSQGACAAGMVASLLEGRERREAFEERERAGRGGVRFPPSFLEGDRVGEGKGEGFVQGPLKFAVAYCGFKAPGERYQAFYEPKIKTPVLHVLGAVDVVVEEERSRGLVGACEGGEGRVVTHPGGHFVPSQKAWLDAVAGFVAECMEGKSGKDGEGKDEKVEDMDVPF